MVRIDLDQALAVGRPEVHEPHAHPGVRVVAVRAHGVDPGHLALELEGLVAGRLERHHQLVPIGRESVVFTKMPMALMFAIDA